MDDIITGTPNSLSAASLRPTATPSVKPPLVSNDGEWSTWNIITIVLIVVVLALLGLNIFSYLAKGTDVIGDFLARFSSHVPETAAKVIDTSVVGTQVAADVAAGTVKDAGDVLSRELNLKRRDLWESRDQGVKKSIENRDMPGINKFPEHEPDKSYKESPEDNNILEKHKPGYCYIGTDRGYRSCIKVNSTDQCESKKIFPSMDICINPSLRQ
jgi:hypothetical protein